MGKAKGRIYELDVLRGLAAIAVVLYHYTTRFGELFFNSKGPYSINFPNGHFGVELFFIISGFVIYMTLVNSVNLTEFIYRRVIRLYPAYLFAVIFTFSIISIFKLPGRETSINAAIANLTMLQGFFEIPHVDGVYWTLTIEISFYAIIGLAFFLNILKRIELSCCIWLAVSACQKLIALVYMNKFIYLAGILFIPDYCNLFIAGIMFYRIKNSAKLRNHLIIIICLLYQAVFHGILSSIFVLTFMGLFYAMIFNKLSFLKIKPFVFLGTISYSLYLIHQNFGYLLLRVLMKYGFSNEIYIIVPITASILCASIITFLIEKPFQRLAREKWRSLHAAKAVLD